MLHVAKKIINFILSKFGFRIVSIKYKFPQRKFKKENFALGYNENDLNLNIGSGGENYPFFINLDLPSAYYKRRQKNHKFVPFDLTKDKIPYDDNTVSNIFCSHVIEHCEDRHVKNFLVECIRVLKKNGVLRISCPDAKFLYDVSSFENEYWHRIKNYKTTWCGRDPISVSNQDCFIYSLSTDKLSLDQKTYETICSDIKGMDYSDSAKFLTKDDKFISDNPGRHINYFDFEKIQNMLKNAFSQLNIQNYKIINSKPRGSISQLMSEDCFGEKQHMSIFVDCVKL